MIISWEKTQAKRPEETTEQHDHWLEQCRMQERAWWLHMSSEEASIRRSADASQLHATRANETP